MTMAADTALNVRIGSLSAPMSETKELVALAVTLLKNVRKSQPAILLDVYSTNRLSETCTQEDELPYRGLRPTLMNVFFRPALNASVVSASYVQSGTTSQSQTQRYSAAAS